MPLLTRSIGFVRRQVGEIVRVELPLQTHEAELSNFARNLGKYFIGGRDGWLRKWEIRRTADCRERSHARFAAPIQDGLAEGRCKNFRPLAVDIGPHWRGNCLHRLRIRSRRGKRLCSASLDLHEPTERRKTPARKPHHPDDQPATFRRPALVFHLPAHGRERHRSCICPRGRTPSRLEKLIGLAIDLSANRRVIAPCPEPSLYAGKLAARAESATTLQSQKVCTRALSNALWRKFTRRRRSLMRTPISCSIG